MSIGPIRPRWPRQVGLG